MNFVYDKAQVATLPPVTLTMQRVTVDAVLKRVFQGSPFEYIYENSTVVIKNGLRSSETGRSGYPESCRIKTGTRFRGYLSC
ncbi:MAG: STN domain-containing protein [Butyricimonas paravirosa]